MTLNEVIARVDTVCPNKLERADKVNFVSTLERRVINEALSRYDDIPYDKNFKKYDPDTDGDRELLAGSPYDHMYIHYVMAEVYLILHEQGHYNNELYIFNGIFADYKTDLIRNHRPTGPSGYRVR